MISRRDLCGGGLAAALAAAWPSLASGDAGEGWPRRFTDALSRTVTLARPPRRIVPLFSSNTEIVAALGAADRIVGIDGMTRSPPEILDRPAVGDRLGFSADLIAKLAPDLVILTPARHAAAMLLRPMQTAGIPVVVLNHPTVNAVLGNIAAIARMLGVEARGERLVGDIRARLARVASGLAGRRPVSVYFETGASARGQSFSVRPEGYTADMLRLAGGASVFPSLPAMTQVGGEAVRHADPDAIVVAGDAAAAAALAARPGWATIPAVAAGRVIAAPRRLFLIPGPQIAAGVDCLARRLHPGALGGSA